VKAGMQPETFARNEAEKESPGWLGYAVGRSSVAAMTPEAAVNGAARAGFAGKAGRDARPTEDL
jgi:hypothetical protein